MNEQGRDDLERRLTALFDADKPQPPAADFSTRVVERVRRRERLRRWLLGSGVVVGAAAAIVPLLQVVRLIGEVSAVFVAPLAAAGLGGLVGEQTPWLVIGLLAALSAPAIHAVIDS
ncbi:MAG: hypothetical protein AAFX58_12090 [Pseudomonadota bacterium]